MKARSGFAVGTDTVRALAPSTSDGATQEEEAAAGLQPEEVECWQQLASFAACLKDLRKLHPMEDHELAHALHALRDSLLARPVLRAIRDA